MLILHLTALSFNYSMGAHTIEVLRIEVVGKVNSFRLADHHTYQRSYLFPPKTTICGMIGSALGYSAGEVNEKLLDTLGIGIYLKKFDGETKDLWKYKKIKARTDTDKTEDTVVIDGTQYFGAILVREWLFIPRYIIYLSSSENSILRDIGKALEHPVYALSLGREDELIKIITIQEVTLTYQNNLYYNNTVLPFNIFTEGYEIDVSSLVPGQRIIPPGIEKIPVKFRYDGETREAVRYETVTSFINVSLKPKVRHGGYVDEKIAIQFF
ncbi:MAG: CRISPR-associated protein Cas5 [Candidatus Jettenia sp. CY-1]|nr:MAG: CRISPR-associated protein Cas5 [Candidatus Jettenia sp. CY-1]